MHLLNLDKCFQNALQSSCTKTIPTSGLVPIAMAVTHSEESEISSSAFLCFGYTITECVGYLMNNLQHMIDVEASECEVLEDYERELNVVRQSEGGSKGVNALVAGVVAGAISSIVFLLLFLLVFFLLSSSSSMEKVVVAAAAVVGLTECCTICWNCNRNIVYCLRFQW